MRMSKKLPGGWKKLDDVAFASAIRMYESGMSLAQIAPQFGISRQSLFGSFKARGVPRRSQLRFGENNHFYRGGSKAKDSAQNKLEKAIQYGRVSRPKTCQHCGIEPPPFRDGRASIQAHHPDYAKPLDVRWLCQKCHHLEHKHA